MATACIVDSDPAARQLLRSLLEAREVQVIGEADNGVEAVSLIEKLRPDLLLTETQLPGLSGMQVADTIQRLDVPPLLLFVTNFPEHTLAAFEYGTLDYLLKPVRPERLEKGLRRALERLAEQKAFRQALPGGVEGTSWSLFLPIHEGYDIALLPIEEILYAEAREKHVFVHTAKHEYRTSHTLKQLEARLPAETFLRIHLSYLINLRALRKLTYLGGRSYAVQLPKEVTLPVGWTHFTALQRRLGLTKSSMP